MSELPGITAREIARDIAFREALERHANGDGSPETVAWCALRAIERAAAREQARPGASAAVAEPARANGEEQPA